MDLQINNSIHVYTIYTCSKCGRDFDVESMVSTCCKDNEVWYKYHCNYCDKEYTQWRNAEYCCL